MPLSQPKTLFIAMLLSIAAAPVMAHHSGAMFDAQKEVTLTGVVKDLSGAIVDGALVSLYRPDGTEPELQTRTSSAGVFSFDSVSPLTYRLVVEHDRQEHRAFPMFGIPGDRFIIDALRHWRIIRVRVPS
jgi:protocatechuate 3,4-dioxygenase beta subunit